MLLYSRSEMDALPEPRRWDLFTAPPLLVFAIFGVLYRARELWRAVVDQQQDAVFGDYVATYAEFPIAYFVATIFDLALLWFSFWLLGVFARQLQHGIYARMKPIKPVS